jgi:hypothetical protein
MPQELREKAQTTDAPSLRHLRTDIFKTLKDKSRLGEPAAVIELRSQARKSSFLTNRLKEMAALQNRRILRRKPRANAMRPPALKTRYASAKNFFLSCMCSELSIDRTVSNARDARSFFSQSHRSDHPKFANSRNRPANWMRQFFPTDPGNDPRTSKRNIVVSRFGLDRPRGG